MRLIRALAVVAYLGIGVLVAKSHGYDLGNLDNWRALISGILAVLMWPLVLLGVSTHIRH
jgi:hypothetical protein